MRIPDDTVAQALVAALGEPLMSSTLLLPGDDEPMARGWEVKERLDTVLDAVVDSGDCLAQPHHRGRPDRRRGRGGESRVRRPGTFE